MRFTAAGLENAVFVELEAHQDARGAFARTFCEAELAAAGIPMRLSQCNISRNPAAGTLRGMHFQRPPHGEAKLVQCVRGRIFDVAVDLRRGSPSFGKWAATQLSADSNCLFYIPAGCAHGFLTLEPDSDVLYYMGAPFVAGAGDGVRWDDPAFAIAWPEVPRLISDRDAGYPDFDPASGGVE